MIRVLFGAAGCYIFGENDMALILIKLKLLFISAMREENVTYHLHTEGAVVDGLILNVDVHKWTGIPTVFTWAESGRHECLVTHGSR